MGDNLPIVNLGSNLTINDVYMGVAYVCVSFTDGRVKCFGQAAYAGVENWGMLGQGNISHIGDEPGEMGDDLSCVDDPMCIDFLRGS